MEGVSTETLKALAPDWSLAGDNHLFNLLQNTHQRIISKCQDVNSKLEEMASALDDASINLQNVNNKFMALSNSQFIESRVYDDDTDLTSETQPAQETPQPSPINASSIHKFGMSALAEAHELTEIIDDSDSDSDAEIRLVMKPKDMYAHRPLPYIIGTQPWKDKWHAGLIVEDSDSDISDSECDDEESDQYSESEEAEETPRPILEDHTVSETSSSFISEPAVEATPPPQPQPKPSDIAAELARRLGGAAQVVQQESEDITPPVPTTRKVYKPEQPATSNIFSDEPPPLDTCEAEDTLSEDDDIFAEINKNKPYTRNTAQNDLAEVLFNFDKPAVEQGDIFSDFAAGNVETKPAKKKATLFEDDSEPDLFAEQPPQKKMEQNVIIKDIQEETGTKKPVGGISLFGSNKSAESIGAAILQRNRRKSSTSSDESESDNIKNQTVEDKPKKAHKNIEKLEPVPKSIAVDETDKSAPKKEKDIFEDLFAKSEKKPVQKIIKEPVREKEDTRVKDLFSDNIFDDIDDIFTSNVKMPIKSAKSNQKSIFDDDDDDDLFSDIAKPISKTRPSSSKENQKQSSRDKKSIFDSDDDLFSEVKTKTGKSATENIESQTINIQTDIKKTTNVNNNQEAIAKTENSGKHIETTKERKLFDDSPQIAHKSETKPQVKSKSIFDSDSDEDIFAKIKSPDDTKSKRTESVLNSNTNDIKSIDTKEDIFNPNNQKSLLTKGLKEEKTNIIQSPSLFEEDEIDELFINANKLDTDPGVSNKDSKIDVKNIPSTARDVVFEKDTTPISKLNTLSNVDSTAYNNVNKSFNELEKNKTGNPLPIPSQEIADHANIFNNKLIEDDLFSTSKAMPSQIISEDIATADIIESSQKGNESSTENIKVASYEQTFKTESRPDDTKIPEAKKRETVIETPKHKQEKENHSVFDDFIVPIKEEATATELKKQYSNLPDLFDDIFSEPPAFEKPIETKKSKNVNALFDDDSDDESLFFKKNDVISDDKPEIFSKNANFDIFVDEPPAIEVNFTKDDELFNPVSKIEQNVPNITKNVKMDKNDEDLFSPVLKMQKSVPESTIPTYEANVDDTTIATLRISNSVAESKLETNIFLKDDDNKLFERSEVENTDVTKTEGKGINALSKDSDSDDDLFSSLPKPDIFKPSQNDESFEQNEGLKSNMVEKIKTSQDFSDIFKSDEPPKKDTETKKIGKLKTKNFNINVNALMPGASPKKIPKERKDEQNIASPESENEPKMVKLFPTGDEPDNYQPKLSSNKSENEERDMNKEEEKPKLEKSIAFEEKLESGVLDNNISKQRPKIQVKRRPSSRRARHEAVRKSAIDFGDETDNSSSFDEPVKSKNLSKEDSQNIKSIQKATDITNQIQDTEQDKTKDTLNKETTSETMDKTSIVQDVDTSILLSSSETDKKDYRNEPSISSKNKTETSQDLTQNISEQKQGSKTKIVYILNDEDIFNTKNKKKETDNNFATKVVETKSDDDIFQSIEGVNTIGKAYKESVKVAVEAINKEEITYKTAEINKNIDNTSTKHVKTSQRTKTSLFDDSDEELFNKNKKAEKKTKIFDSDSEEDLFIGKTKTEKQNKEKWNKEVKETIEVNVKGSLFGDEDDDDLFSLKKEKNEPKRSSVPSTSKEATVLIASTSAEPVFEDPLSTLGYD